MTEKLFKFPIIMIDGHKEEKKEARNMSLNLEEDDLDLEIIYGHAECPYNDFLSISDRWLPDDVSYENAMNGKFNACFVQFDKCGTFIVPWTRDRFKKELNKFITECSTSHTIKK